MFLFPDNGVITFVAQEMPMQAIHVFQNPTLMPAQLSSTFHGRDLFAPLAGLLLNDMPLGRLGPQPDTYKLLEIAQATEHDHEIVGQVLYADHFGNLVTNIPERMIRGRWSDLEKLNVTCAGRQIEGVRASYAFAGVGEALSLFNSMHLLEIAVNQGRAREILQAPIGAEVRVKPGGNS
jgi:S-adenosylmethionine hydrolase